MTKSEYINYALKKRLYRKLNWFYTLFVITIKPELSYCKIEDGKFYVKIDNVFTVLDGVDGKTPALTMSDIVTISKENLDNLDKDITTQLGRILVNKIMLSDVFGNIIPFINKRIKVGDLEAIIAKELAADTITVDEYLKFINTCSYMHGLSRITTYSATERTMLPPKGITEFKKKLAKEMLVKYGEDWVKDRAKIVEFETALKAYDAEWLKDDPTMGKMTSGKASSARSKLYLTFGSEVGFDKKSGEAALVENSLLEGFPKDKQLLTNMFNTSRSGSYDRGKETQKGGSAAKDILRAVSSLTIKDGDCGAVVGKTMLITKENANTLLNRYILLSNKQIELVTDPEQYIGKVITRRSPQYCRSTGNSFCAVCAGKALANYKKGIAILVTDISSIMLATSMSAMHFKPIQTIEFNILDAIK